MSASPFSNEDALIFFYPREFELSVVLFSSVVHDLQVDLRGECCVEG